MHVLPYNYGQGMHSIERVLILTDDRHVSLFILGAGAHFPYDMPLGSELARRIIKELPAKLPEFNPHGPVKFDKVSEICTQVCSGCAPLFNGGPHSLFSRMVEFRNRLELAGQQSIDDFPHISRYARPLVSEARLGRVAVGRARSHQRIPCTHPIATPRRHSAR